MRTAVMMIFFVMYEINPVKDLRHRDYRGHKKVEKQMKLVIYEVNSNTVILIILLKKQFG